ncbi:hypothetical protein AGMMS49587_20070 [Spirochaetia bacterium]|nr:hypothetical protein AGMMS49587_20070 [Spirochaetia bacterium]
MKKYTPEYNYNIATLVELKSDLEKLTEKDVDIMIKKYLPIKTYE